MSECERCGTTNDVEVRQIRFLPGDSAGTEPDETLCDGCFYDEYLSWRPDLPGRDEYIELKRKQRAA